MTSLLHIEAAESLGRERSAQREWAAQHVASRLKVFAALRRYLADQGDELLRLTAEHRGVSAFEALTSELMPLADACKWLVDNAARLLRPRVERDAAWSMRRLHLETFRESLGVVLIVAPGNFPLFLAGVQMLQALAAGNAVLLKPAPGTTALMACLRDALVACGLPPRLLTVLGEKVDEVRNAIASGIDHVVLTGSARTGRSLRQLVADAGRPIGVTEELSGADVCLLLPGADLALAAKAVRFAATLNRGRTCIAPRIVLVPAADEESFLSHLRSLLGDAVHLCIGAPELRARNEFLRLAFSHGATEVCGGDDSAIVLRGSLDLDLPWETLFSPIVFVARYHSLSEALEFQRSLPLALGASVFGPEQEARRVALQLDACVVTVNDLVAPTADPRVPFAARKHSGTGVTRGAEGLLAMTQAKAVVTQRSRFLPHLELPHANDLTLVRALLRLRHGSNRMHALAAFINAVRARRKLD